MHPSTSALPVWSPAAFDQTRAPVERARHAPGYIYTSPDVYQREKRKIFMRDWLYVGREEEFANPGDFRAFHVLEEPVVVCRDTRGTLNAFANVCRHRGVEVAYGQGNTAKGFSCPYHAWLYDLTGRLVTAPLMKASPGFDPSNCRLPPIRLEVWAGNVFICFDETPPPFREYAADFVKAFEFLRLEDFRLSGKMTVTLDCNWKFGVENLLDTYHIRTLHYSSFGQYTHAEASNVTLTRNGGVHVRYISAPAVPGGKTLFGKIPALADQPDNIAMSGYLCPNTQLFLRMDQARMLITWPLGPDRCEVIYHSLFPKHLFDRPDFAEKAAVYHKYITDVLEEDRTMVQSLQRAASAREFVPGPMADLEQGIHHCLNNMLDRLFDEP